MKTLILPLLFTFCSLFALAQPDLEHSLHINYKKCWPRNASNIRLGHIIRGMQHSNGSVYGLVKPFSGGVSSDADGLARLNNDFDTMWTKKYGGSDEDNFQFIEEMPNGRILITGTTYSKDGDVWYGRPFAFNDMWLMLVDTNGNILKGNVFGGFSGRLSSTCLGADGSIYMAGFTEDNTLDFTHVQYSPGNTDLWYAKLDTGLNLLWCKVIPGDEVDFTTIIRSVNRDRLVLCSASPSMNADFLPAEARGGVDHFVCYLDTAGNVIWKHRYGGTQNDLLQDIQVDTARQLIYLLGNSQAGGGDFTYSTTDLYGQATPKSENMGFICLDTLGNVKGAQMYGAATKYNNCEGSAWYAGAKIYKGRLWAGIYILGSSYPLGPGWGDADSNVSYAGNTLIVVIDSTCTLKAKYTINGTGNDEVWDNFIKDSVLYFTGFNGGLPNNQMNTFRCDTANTFQFIISFTNTPLEITEPTFPLNNQQFSIYPNPTQDILTIEPQEASVQEVYTLRIMSSDGRLLYRASKLKGRKQLQIADWPVGIYYAELEQKGIRQNITFSKQ
ncbi:MAG: T9SS type A sorting domain-containing protein [Chitinophagaceae bacterium]|nr:T9SS type A sorting domain-containing protein [Chitinophagaceae bacterium]